MYNKRHIAKAILEAWNSAVRDFQAARDPQFQDALIFARHELAYPWQVAGGQ